MLRKDYQNIPPKGFVTLMLVMVTSAVGIVIATSMILAGLNSSRNSFTLIQSQQVKAVADACAERGLEAIRDNPASSGTTSLTLGEDNCTYTITVQSGENRIVDAAGTVGTVKRKVRVNVSAIKPKINVSSWQEIQ